MKNTIKNTVIAAAIVASTALVSTVANAAGYYQDWYVNDNGVGVIGDSADDKNFLIFVPAKGDNRAYTYISFSDSICTEKYSSETALKVNTQYVKFNITCASAGAKREMTPATVAGDAYVIEQLKTGSVVDINGGKYSALGFTDTFNYLTNGINNAI